MAEWLVPLTDIAVTEQDLAAVEECLRSGWLTMGPRTKAFEDALAAYTGSPHVLTVSSGTAALHLSCLAAGLQPGDEVIVPALTFIASAAAPRYLGCKVVLCDIVGPHDFNIDVEDVARRITERTRAVIAVHFCGYPADVLRLRELCDENGIALIEDCAQAIGARVEDARQVGTVGELGAFSFFSKKQLCVGEGGMVATADDELAERVRRLRSHAMTSGTWERHSGLTDTYDVVGLGFNYRLDEPRSALGSAAFSALTPTSTRDAQRSAPTASGSRESRGSRFPGTTRSSSAPATSPSRCCSRTVRPEICFAPSSRPQAFRRPGTPLCTPSPSAAS